jgi:hypothetical protein
MVALFYFTSRQSINVVYVPNFIIKKIKNKQIKIKINKRGKKGEIEEERTLKRSYYFSFAKVPNLHNFSFSLSIYAHILT